MLTGGCFCGAVRYEVADAAFQPALCHCSDCRRIAGAPKRFRSSVKVERQFCEACGTGLTYRNADFPEEIDVTICSLDAPELMPPKDHIWIKDRLHWVRLADGLPEYEKTHSG